MIGERFVRYPKRVAPRNLPRVNQFCAFMDRKSEDATRRASYITPNGYGSRLLVEIIKLANLDSLLAPGDLYKRMGDNLLAITKDLEKPIDVRIGKHTTHSLFVRSKTPCFELMTASRRKNPLFDIPWDLPYSDPKWRTIRPLRISDMGSTDLRFQVYSDLLVYQAQGPTHVIFSLDCFALVSMFVAYYRAQTRISNLDQCLLDFVHKEVIVPTLLNDSIAIWLRNVYKRQFLSLSPLDPHTSTIWDVVNIDANGSEFTGAMMDVQHLSVDLKNQSTTTHTVMSSLLLGSNISFTDYYQELFETSTTPDEQPYVWVDCLKNLSWWEFILMLSSMTPNIPDVISLKRDVVRDVRFWCAMKPWQNVHLSVPYKSMIQSRLEGMLSYLQAG